jgi:tight adherence protein B
MQLALATAIVTIFGGIGLTRQLHKGNQKKLLESRLLSVTQTKEPISILRDNSLRSPASGIKSIQVLSAKLTLLAAQAGSTTTTENLLSIGAILLLLPLAAAATLELNLLAGFFCGILLSAIPILVLLVKKAGRRKKFIEQLPDAIDLMISVLRSGHSIPQGVKAVGQEVPAPCGPEFMEVLQRMNLGLQLPDALSYSCSKFSCHELDLLRRAFAIQSEVGGSLAELLEKTNTTLRQRLKLVKQVAVLTAQSRLTMVVVGALPIVMAIALNAMNPRYLLPLMESELGKTLIAAAVALEIVGLVIMKKLATVKV